MLLSGTHERGRGRHRQGLGRDRVALTKGQRSAAEFSQREFKIISMPGDIIDEKGPKEGHGTRILQRFDVLREPDKAHNKALLDGDPDARESLGAAALSV